MIPLFRVVKSGVYATIQDEGRFGFRRFGMPVAGPMDRLAFQLGQDIIGNDDSRNALELFLGGLTVEVLTDHRIVIAGADLVVMIDGETPAPLWKTFQIWKGQTISFSKPISGAIAYIIPEGGYAVKKILGSSSSYPRGLIGETVKKETILYANTSSQKRLNRGLLVDEIPRYELDITVELFKSPHIDLFEKSSVDTFLNASYTYRGGIEWVISLTGPRLSLLIVETLSAKRLNLELCKSRRMVSQLF